MIIRVFRGRVRPGAQEGFERLLRTAAVPRFRAHPGVMDVRLGMPGEQEPEEFLVITVWRDLDSLRDFAGETWLRPKLTPQERPLLQAAYVHHYRGSDAEPIGLPGSEQEAPAATPSTRRRALLLAGPSLALEATVGALRGRGFEALVAPTAESALRLLERWHPDVAVVAAESDAGHEVRRAALGRELATIVVGGEEDLRPPSGGEGLEVGVLAPARPEEIAGAAEIVANGKVASAVAGAVELGTLRLDLGQRLVEVEDRLIELPPTEFRVLAELAARAEQPVPAAELARLVWPESAWTTAEDVRRAVYRLRKLLGDQQRARPLIRNRRGHGYVLQP